MSDSELRLVDVKQYQDVASVLWTLLECRPPEANISHKTMPSWEEHVSFVARYKAVTGPKHPYEWWYILEVGGVAIGSIYLTWESEIGIGLFEEYWGKGWGRRAVLVLMASCGPRRYLANISPNNPKSQIFFRKLGFKCIQHTFELEQR